MSERTPSVVVLDKGINLQVPKLVAPAGTVLDMLNYEHVDFQGQKRIDGYVRYDASVGSYIDDYYIAVLDDVPQNFLIGDTVLNNGELMGIVVDANIVPEDSLSFALIDLNQLPEPGDEITNADGGVIGTVSEYMLGKDSGISPDLHYERILAYNAILRARVTGLPGPIAGLHWFRDRLYAVAGVTRIQLDGLTPLLYPNDSLSFDSGGAVVHGTILEVDYVEGNRLVSIDSDFWDLWQTTGQSIYRINTGNELVGTLDDVLTEDVAQFFESRTEQQAQDELSDYDLYGWNGIHLGWTVPFEEGISLYGSLPSLNQNISGLGIQGPTSIAGSSGKPLRLAQKVTITNGQTQVNGWKNSDTPTSYQLFPINVAETDALNVYADGFISWDGETEEVLAPGINDGELIEYPATNTVPVTI